MCWNTEFSLASAVVGWITCIYLWRRNHSPRDKWYATYLVTYTFTQLVDIALWQLHARHAPLQGCPSLKDQWGRLPDDEAQLPQYLISKYVIPLVVLSQHYVQLRYPSDLLKDKRVLMTWLHALPCAGMSLTFACTDIVHSVFPSAHETLRWGGHSSETWQVLIVCFVVMLDFYLTMPERSVFLAHVLTFGSVIGTLWATEGTLALGSKWCTYCLIFSFVSATDPIWGPGPGKRARAKAPAQSRREGLRSGATPLKTKGA